MRMRPLNALALLAPAPALAAQAPFASAWLPAGDWSFAHAPPANATGHLIFDTVRSLLQHWPNTRYRNGHAIVPGTVPAGTLLYHGTGSDVLPTVPEWTATDPEHSLLFCRAMRMPFVPNATDPEAEAEGGCYHLTLAATRPLKVLYFDGSSAAKMSGGPMDSQDLVAWGVVREEKVFAERERLTALCEWAAPLGVDGFVRMEMDFEIMLCDFTAGVEVVSFLKLASPAERGGPPQGPPRDPKLFPIGGLPTTRAGTPVGLDARVLESGSWHNVYPGDARITLDYTRLLTLYDASLAPSLALARTGIPRLQHRLAHASPTDLARFREVLDAEITAWVAEVDAGVVVGGTGSGTDWRTLFNTLAERYAARLEVLEYLLNTTDTGTAGRAQRQLRGMIAPYVLQDATPDFHTNASPAGAAAGEDDKYLWAAGTFEQCATMHTASIARRYARLTRGERVLLRAAEDTAREICRVLVGMWAEGVEQGLGTGTGARHASLLGLGAEEKQALVARWHARVTGLMGWLDWSGYWLRCRPACGFEEMCMLPTWPFFTFPGRRGPRFMERVRDVVERRAAPDEEEGGDWQDPQPSCMRIVEPTTDDDEMWVVV